jgi:hypothetical protein
MSLSNQGTKDSSDRVALRSRQANAEPVYFTGSLTKATLLRPAFEASASVSAT